MMQAHANRLSNVAAQYRNQVCAEAQVASVLGSRLDFEQRLDAVGRRTSASRNGDHLRAYVVPPAINMARVALRCSLLLPCMRRDLGLRPAEINAPLLEEHRNIA